MGARAISTGTITFGLVTVPVKLYSATSSKGVSFNMLHDKDKSRLKQHYTCSLCGETVERAHTVKGYEYAKDQYVVVVDEELKGLEKKSDQTIEIEEFVPMVSVDAQYFEKTQLLGPDKGGHKAYALLREAMEKSGKVALGRFSTRGKQQLVLVRPVKEGLMLHGLYYHDEVRSFEDVDTGGAQTLKPNELNLAIQLIEQLSVDTYRAEKHEDGYRTQLLGLIERKVQGQEIVSAPAAQPQEQIIDLMEALKASLAAKHGANADVAERKPALAKVAEARPAPAKRARKA